MDSRRRPLVARLILGALVLACLTWLFRLDPAQHFTTDVLELVPADRRDPALMLVRQMASQQQARSAWFLLERTRTSGDAGDSPVPKPAIDAFVATLRASPAFSEVVNLADPEIRDAIGTHLFQHRFELLLPDWLAERVAEHAAQTDAPPFEVWLAKKTVRDLDGFLSDPAALAFDRLLPADPLLLMPRFADQASRLAGDNGGQTDDSQVRIWAQTTASPLSEAGQQPVFDAVADALAAAQTIAPDLELRWTAVSRFAAESRRRIQAEMATLNTLALAAVLVVAALCLRRVWNMLHLAPGVLGSLLGAWTITTLVYERVHVLVFVIGSLLAGIAADYGLHIYLHPGPPDETWAERMRAVRRPLLGSALTAMIGFSALLLADLPLLRQIGVFVLSGLVAAIGFAVLWFAQVQHPRGDLRPVVQRGFLAAGRGLRAARWIALVLVAAVVVTGLPRMHWRDDIRDLEIRVPALWENDLQVRTEFGENASRALYLARGRNPAEARETLAAFERWLRQEQPDTPPASFGFALPTPSHLARLPEHLARLTGFADALRAELERQEFSADEFAPFFRAWETLLTRRDWPDFSTLLRDFSSVVHGPTRLSFATEDDASWFAVVLDRPLDAGIPAGIDVVDASQLTTLNQLFSGHRHSVLRLSVIGALAGSLCVLAIYGRRHGPRMILVPAVAAVFTFGVLGLTGQTLNLFHLLGAFLALCLSLDYAIFTGDRAARGETGPPPSVRLSALNTVASFGILAFSKIPVVAGLGVTVALLVASALAMVELEIFRSKPAATITPPR